MEFVIQQLITGLSLASILLLVALGLSIIYGALGVINLAHGEFLMLGAYAAWLMQTEAGIGLLGSLVVIFVVVAAFGWLVEQSLIRRLHTRPLDTILATWGIAVILQQSVRLAAGGELRYVEMPAILSGSFTILGETVSAYRVFILFVVAALFAATWYIMYRTEIGMKLRAVIQDREVAATFGIDSRRVHALAFAYGSGLAGLAGALVAPMKSVSPEMGTGFVVDAFMVVVLGGVESLIGTVASALLIGEMTGVLAAVWNDTIAKATVFLVIIVVIRFRPRGLFVSKVRG